MASFTYRAATASGEMRSGVLDAADQDEALERLRRLGLIPVETARTAAAAVLVVVLFMPLPPMLTPRRTTPTPCAECPLNP